YRALMKRVLEIVPICTLAVARPNKESPPTASTPPSTATHAAATSAPADGGQPAGGPKPAATLPAAPSAGGLRSQVTQRNGIVAEVTEFRRKGNTLTAKVRFTNHGTEEPQPEVHYGETYLIDTAAGKKYNVLKDEKDEYIASLKPSWHDRWFKHLKPGESQV